MKNKQDFEEIFKEVLKESLPNQKEILKIKKEADNFLLFLRKLILKSNKKIDVFVGGSFAKSTFIKKKDYEIDIFLRFHCKEEEIIKNFRFLSAHIKKEAKIKFKNLKFFEAHGSRKYLNLSFSNLIFEIVPVQYIKNQKQAKNSTDLSYFHVKYINKKIKQNQKLKQEIILSKLFLDACNCYGAESYIGGFSGYAVELLIVYYKTFPNFLKNFQNITSKKIIDIEKKYNSKQEVLREMNEAKINNPIILIDPTFKSRNATSSLSEETLFRLKKHISDFFKNPNKNLFFKEKVRNNKIKQIFDYAKKKNLYLAEIEAKTGIREQNIAGAKFLKLFNLIIKNSVKYMDIKKKYFIYVGGGRAFFIFAVKLKDEIIFKGPPKNKKEHVLKFKKKHKSIFLKEGRFYSKKRLKLKFNDTIKKILKKTEPEIKKVNISNIKIIS